MKTRLLKWLRRKAKRQVQAKWNGYELTIVWNRWQAIDEGYLKLTFEMGNDRNNDDFYVSGGTVFKDIDDVKSGLVAARRCAILTMVNERKDEMIRKKIQNL